MSTHKRFGNGGDRLDSGTASTIVRRDRWIPHGWTSLGGGSVVGGTDSDVLVWRRPSAVWGLLPAFSVPTLGERSFDMVTMFEITFLIVCAVLGLFWFSRTRLGQVGLLVAGMLLTTAPAATADTYIGTDHNGCSYGDAKATSQAFYPFFEHKPREENSIPPCQYRIWLDMDHFTFTEDDWFFGGNALAFDYKAEGITRHEAIAILERVGHRLWLARIDSKGERIGPLVEQSLKLSGFRDVSEAGGGTVVYQQVGLILQLPPGDYVSVYEESFDGQPFFDADVILHIVPSGYAT
jgi:hypothetical protein